MVIDIFIILLISCSISLVLGGLLGASILYSYLVTELLVNPKSVSDHLESLGMYPPDTTIQACPDPMFQVFIEHIDIPSWVVLGWDNE